MYDNPFSWDILLRLCTLAYNSNAHQSLLETPVMMMHMFGLELTLPIDLAMALVRNVEQFETMPDYVLDLQDRLHKALLQC